MAERHFLVSVETTMVNTRASSSSPPSSSLALQFKNI
jgi:hypothetical protein